MWKLLLVGTATICLFGCAREIKLTSEFQPAQAQFINSKGRAQIDGQAFLRRNDGIVVYAAGSDVRLVPHTTYAEERIGAVFGPRKFISKNQSDLIKIEGHPQFREMQRVVKANGEGRFSFPEVGPGSYYVLTDVLWCVPRNYGCDPQGGGLREQVKINAAES